MDETYYLEPVRVSGDVRLRGKPASAPTPLAALAGFVLSGFVGCWLSINVIGPTLLRFLA